MTDLSQPSGLLAKLTLAPRVALMLALGVLTSAIALYIAFEAASRGTNLMFWYSVYVVPTGAIVLGLVASSGFALGAKLFGVRMGPGPLALTLLLLLAAFLGAQYVEFRALYPNGVVDDSGELIGFWRYLDLTTRAIHFKNGKPLEIFGYFFRVVALIGFAAAGVYGPFAMVGERQHCARCGRFHQDVVMAHMPAHKDAELALIRANVEDPAQLTEKLETLAPQETWAEAAQADERYLCRLSWCPGCRDGEVLFEKLAGLPNQKSGRVFERYPMAPTKVVDLLKRWRAAA